LSTVAASSRFGFAVARPYAWLAIIAFALASAKALRSYGHSRDELRPPRGPVEMPAELGRIGKAENVRFVTAGGVDVHGWYLPSTSGAALLFVHGSPGTRRDLLPEAEAMNREGYGALLLDMPGHGESGGAPDWGVAASDAARGGIDFLAHRSDVAPERIGAFGFSMGSVIVADLAIHDRRVAAVVLAGAFTRFERQLEYEFRSWGPISQWPAVRTSSGSHRRPRSSSQARGTRWYPGRCLATCMTARTNRSRSCSSPARSMVNTWRCSVTSTYAI
jgi:pimeloyl-ACP methyl ester carboxylesterase